jgi:DNA polymerase phi
LFSSLNGSTKADVLQKIVQEKPKLGFAVIVQITGIHGSQQFDKLTNTKIVESILTAMDVEGIRQYIQYLMKQVNHLDGIKQ